MRQPRRPTREYPPSNGESGGRTSQKDRSSAGVTAGCGRRFRISDVQHDSPHYDSPDLFQATPHALNRCSQPKRLTDLLRTELRAEDCTNDGAELIGVQVSERNGGEMVGV